MQHISFGLSISPVKANELNKIAQQIGRENGVYHPWTIEQSVKAPNAFTTNVIDCSACLITDGQEVLMMHLDPSKESNHFFYFIFDYIKRKIDLNSKDLQAVLIGSKNNKRSQDIYTKFQQFLKDYSIPYTQLKDGKTPTSVAYKSSTDTVYVSNLTMDKMLKKGASPFEALKKSFQKVEISDCDEIA